MRKGAERTVAITCKEGEVANHEGRSDGERKEKPGETEKESSTKRKSVLRERRMVKRRKVGLSEHKNQGKGEKRGNGT